MFFVAHFLFHLMRRHLVAAVRLMFSVIPDILIGLPLPTQPGSGPPAVFYCRTMLVDNSDHFIDIVVRGVVGNLQRLLAFIQPNTIDTGQFINFGHKFIDAI